MFKNKNLILLLILIVLAAGGYIIARGVPFVSNTTPLFPDLSPSQATEITITLPEDETVTLEKKEQWVVASQNNAPADEQNVQTLLEDLDQITTENLISQNPSKQKDLGVDETGTHVVIKKGDVEMANMYIGRIGPGFNSTYIRKKDDTNVYLTYRVLGAVVNPLDWRDLGLLNFDVNAIQSIGIEYEGSVFVLKKQGNENAADAEWKVTEGGDRAVNSQKVKDMLFQISTMKSKDIDMEADLKTTGITGSNWKYTLSSSNGGVYEMIVGDVNDMNQYYVKTHALDGVYMVVKDSISKLPTSVDALMD